LTGGQARGAFGAVWERENVGLAEAVFAYQEGRGIATRFGCGGFWDGGNRVAGGQTLREHRGGGGGVPAGEGGANSAQGVHDPKRFGVGRWAGRAGDQNCGEAQGAESNLAWWASTCTTSSVFDIIAAASPRRAGTGITDSKQVHRARDNDADVFQGVEDAGTFDHCTGDKRWWRAGRTR